MQLRWYSDGSVKWMRSLLINYLENDNLVMVTVHEDIESDPQSYLDRWANFIGLPRLKLKSMELRHVLASEDMTEPRH
jgi:hypothetical protein